jgi:hypothetical protein
MLRAHVLAGAVVLLGGLVQVLLDAVQVEALLLGLQGTGSLSVTMTIYRHSEFYAN